MQKHDPARNRTLDLPFTRETLSHLRSLVRLLARHIPGIRRVMASHSILHPADLKDERENFLTMQTPPTTQRKFSYIMFLQQYSSQMLDLC